MKKFLPYLLVIVYLNSGKVIKYPTAKSVCDNAEPGGMFDGGHPATVIYISDWPSNWQIGCHTHVLASFPLTTVERYEIQ